MKIFQSMIHIHIHAYINTYLHICTKYIHTYVWYICTNNNYLCKYVHPYVHLHMYVYTVLPQIIARAFISFQQLFTLATKRDRRLYKAGVY